MPILALETSALPVNSEVLSLESLAQVPLAQGVASPSRGLAAVRATLTHLKPS